ncbi:MAG: DUF4391 domain-containing protein [Pseudomonadales bacterium]|nr:DUF4391 domain-containing protein [Pseudomonadales bacterium]
MTASLPSIISESVLNHRLRFPDNASFGGNIPKTRIYQRSGATASIKQKFVQQLDKITWACKLAPETINLPAGSFVKEIQVFDLTLKSGIEEVDEVVLRTMDKAIIHPLFYRINKNETCRYAMAYKRQHESASDKWVVDDYFYSPWMDGGAVEQPLPQALNLQSLYEALLRLLLPEPATTSESLPKQIARLHEIAVIQRAMARLESAIAKEKQFNRKVELNAEMRTLQQQLKGMI